MTTVVTSWETPRQRHPAHDAAVVAPAGVERAAEAAGLRVRSIGIWPDAPSEGIESGSDGAPADLPGVAGFIVSSFNPLVVEVARRALVGCYGAPPVPVEEGMTTAVILVSRYGDVVSARAVAQAVDDGSRVWPLLFFQSVPNAVVGYVATGWGLSGPVLAISPSGDPVTEGMEVASLLIADGDADRALLIVVEQAAGRGAAGESTMDDVPAAPDADPDRGLAILVERRR